MTDLNLAGRDRLAAAGMRTAIARNEAFAAAGGHEGASLFPTLGLLVISCLDARVDPARILGLDVGEALVIRNNGGRVTPQLINDLAYVSQLAETARPEGPLFEVAVIHHTQCGAARLADDAFRHRYAERIGANESTLRDYAILDPATTVIEDVDRLLRSDAISPRVTVSGHTYDIATGRLQTVIPAARAA